MARELVYQGLLSRGLPDPIAQGFLANFAVESGFDPGINEIKPLVPGSRGGFGLAQWTGPRRRQLESFASERGKPVNDLDLQLDFLMHELGSTEKRAAEAIMAAQSPEEATRLISNKFLRPGIPHMDRRLAALGGDVPAMPKAAPQTGSPSLLGGAAADTLEAAPMPQMGLLAAPEPEPMTFGQGVRNAAQSGALWENLAQAFNSLSVAPSSAPAQIAQAGQRRRELAAQEEEQNRRRMQAAQFFEAQGRPDLAQAVMSGVIDGGAAFGAQRQDAQMSQAQAAQAQQAQQQQAQMNRTLAFIDALPDDDPRKPLAALAAQNGDMGTAMKILQQGAEAAPAAFQTLQARAAAAGLQPGTPEYQQFMLNSGGGQTINLNTGPQGIQYPDPPSGFTYGRNPDGTIALTETQMPGGGTTQVPQLVPLPGSAAATQAQETTEKETERARVARIQMGTTLENLSLNINEIENGGVPVTGPVGALGGLIPGTPQTDFRNRNTQITTRAALDEVQQMRDNSPTGGAVGQLTDSEREAIGVAATSLATSSSAEEYVRSAKRFRKVMLDTAYGEGNWRIDPDTGEIVLRTNTGQRASPAPQQGSRLRYNPATGEFE